MNISKQNIDKLNAVVKIQLQPADYSAKVEQAIKEHAKKVNMPGFRKGMVPAGHVRKMYGKSILVDEINTMLSEGLNNYIEENKIQVLGQPLPKFDNAKNYNWDFNDAFEFEYELGLAPEFDLAISSKDKFTKYKVSLDAETLDQRKKNLRRSYGKMTNPEVSAQGDVIYADFIQLSPKGEVFEGGIHKAGTLRTDLVTDKSIAQSLVGLKINDELTIDLGKAISDKAMIARILDIDEAIAADLKSSFKMIVKGVSRLEESDLTQEFYDRVYGPGVVTTEAEMEQKIREDLEGIMNENADRRLYVDMSEGILSKMKLTLPDEFLKRWLKASNNKEITEAELTEQYPNFAKSLQWTLIENRIIKDNEIKIEYQELFELAKKRLDAQFRLYSPAPMPDDQLGQYTAQYLQNRENANRIFDELRAQKTFDYLKTVVTVEEKPIDYKKFLELK